MCVSVSELANYPSPKETKWMQIIYSPRHWLLAAKGFLGSDSIVVYDSMKFTTEGRQLALATLPSLVRTKDSIMKYTVAACQRQASGSNDCGFFAVAFATSLAHGKDPCKRLYDSTKGRSHFKKCFNIGHLSLFPSTERKDTRGKNIGPEISTIAIYCNCRRTYNEHARFVDCNVNWFMIQCVKCKEEFHQMCENYPENTKNDWFCRSCSV